jgi:hypothetical protein
LIRRPQGKLSLRWESLRYTVAWQVESTTNIVRAEVFLYTELSMTTVSQIKVREAKTLGVGFLRLGTRSRLPINNMK